MTKYTDRRGYPYPTDAKETGNGGLHSELLARSVAADLDTVDASWVAEMQHATLMMTKNGDQTGISSGAETVLTTFTTEKQTSGVGLVANPILRPVSLAGVGWYHVIATLRSKASGAITAGAQHRIQFKIYGQLGDGSLVLRDTRYSESFQQGSLDMFNELEAMIYLGATDQLRVVFFHLNAASTGTVVGASAGTRISATKILGV